jgi:hypothetical protein
VINGLTLNITKISVHFVNQNDNTTGEWITIFEGSKTIDLLKYSNVTGIFPEKELDSGKYTQIRLYIGSSNINLTNTFTQFYNKIYPLVIPSSELKLIHPFTIESNKSLLITLDFDVDRAVTRTSDGQYKMDPTIGLNITDKSVLKGQRPEGTIDL